MAGFYITFLVFPSYSFKCWAYVINTSVFIGMTCYYQQMTILSCWELSFLIIPAGHAGSGLLSFWPRTQDKD